MASTPETIAAPDSYSCKAQTVTYGVEVCNFYDVIL